MSEWQMPQNLMSIRTSLGPTARRWISNAASGASGADAPTARAVVVSLGAAVKVVSVMPSTLDALRAVRGVLRAPPNRLRKRASGAAGDPQCRALRRWYCCEPAQRRIGRRALVRGGQEQRQAGVSPQLSGLEDEIEVADERVVEHMPSGCRKPHVVLRPDGPEVGAGLRQLLDELCGRAIVRLPAGLGAQDAGRVV